MANNDLIEQIVNEVLKNVGSTGAGNKTAQACSVQENNLNAENAYPLSKKRPDLIKTSTGKTINDIKIEDVLNGKITPDDIKITPEVLLYQAQIAESVGRKQFAQNLRRAAELTKVPDARVLEIYGALRPHRSTKQELLDIAKELEDDYNAKINASLIREAAEVYEKRNMFRA
ncbi:diol dehydratase small subunit [Clostridium luticellarii]|jgi:propanediol dehydratase small subunit|uniref:Propanediol dehydratase small subunit n=1 Tax=Clostridium luticellarii TaxID=1691940 RepID=A0A2T0BPC0_9CLOT|nr:diol dehydratase small subunit [Clostridium luticellarii]MCI1945025.1 diol dehydratase small subunit [Clostridium luticellarii]MCI1967576.1 diol dehydratase small subunit [Clostridium luticellarii]MCI1995726.1 diol dehydratase small subunit [Clostridium luticellarii]MCI2040064.1 diol dehydratase small subunit [Clostridium luticellarii]PRR85731.1 Propanediol dehydratase small subunit [Clostridium luticellarii]